MFENEGQLQTDVFSLYRREMTMPIPEDRSLSRDGVIVLDEKQTRNYKLLL